MFSTMAIHYFAFVIILYFDYFNKCKGTFSSLQALRLARCLRDNKYPNILFFKCKGQTFRNSPRNRESQILKRIENFSFLCYDYLCFLYSEAG